ncbi:MAG TPA: FAD-binding oxidoreductase [Dongiaceae bacterium]|nr:FAD-binding oxidoreductase [Dongiaceae bacterium]
MSRLTDKEIATLKSGFGGEVITPADASYHDARTIWNGMIDKHPAVIARSKTSADVARAVNFARERGLLLAVRGGGHNIGGLALCDGGLVVDLSLMKAATVDPVARLATIEAGALLADLDAATQAHGLATPLGINSTTGIAGLTLGGGFGWLSRRHGLTVDNLEAAEVVTARGEVVRASASENADLFWALRGGGGNFGIVTRFTYRLHPVGPEVTAGLIVYSAAESRQVLRGYREFAAGAPEDLTVWAVLRDAPPLPFLPAETHGKGMIALALLYLGEAGRAGRLIDPLRRFGTPIGEHVGPMPYTAWQQMFDPLLGAGARNYWKSHNLASLGDGLIDAAVDAAGRLPSPECEVFIAALGGAASRPAPTATAYAHRDAAFVMNVHGRWQAAADDARCVGWARAFFDATAPFAHGGAYVNFMTAEESGRIPAAYGVNYARLAQVKRAWDPQNLFSVNQNIRPAAA